jgi:hypothetical protein
MAIIGIMAIIGRGGRTVATMVPVGIRVTELMSLQGMAITLIPASATTLAVGIHAPTITMAIRGSPAAKV